jgi:hypothetical protein
MPGPIECPQSSFVVLMIESKQYHQRRVAVTAKSISPVYAESELIWMRLNVPSDDLEPAAMEFLDAFLGEPQQVMIGLIGFR